MPKLTVLMPVYNARENFLRQSIESVFNQTFEDYEFLIIDDKSQNDSRDIVLSYRDKPIRFVQNKENLGQMQTLNIGIGLSCGKYIARMDQDDISLPERFEKEVKIMDKFEDIGLVYSDSFIIDGVGARKKKTLFGYVKPYRSFVFDKLLERNFIIGNTVVIRKRIFEDIGLFNPTYPIGAEYDLFLRLAQRYKIDFINEPLAEYRAHGENSSANAEKTTKEAIEILENLDKRALGKKQNKILNRTISCHKANLGMCYLFQYNRKLCREKAIEALRMKFFNPKAFVAIFISIFFTKFLIDYISPFRREWLK